MTCFSIYNIFALKKYNVVLESIVYVVIYKIAKFLCIKQYKGDEAIISSSNLL